MTALQISPKMESLYMDCVERPQGFATFTRLPFGQFSLKTFKLDWVSFHSVTSLVESQYVFLGFTHVTNSLATVTIRHLGVPQA